MKLQLKSKRKKKMMDKLLKLKNKNIKRKKAGEMYQLDKIQFKMKKKNKEY